MALRAPLWLVLCRLALPSAAAADPLDQLGLPAAERGAIESWRSARRQELADRGAQQELIWAAYLSPKKRDPYVHALEVAERVLGGGSCRESVWVLSLPHRFSTVPPGGVVPGAIEGSSCCPGTDCRDTPLGGMLRYIRLVRGRDAAGLRSLASPDKLQLRLDTGYFGGKKRRSLRPEQITKKIFAQLEPLRFVGYQVHCPPSFADDGVATCQVDSVTGFSGSYTFRQTPERIVLEAIREITERGE